MRRRFALLVLVLAIAGPAAAAPCEVTISRAPDEVREAIETWVRAEPRCATTLDVRVVPTNGGFYLFARDPSGRVRERVVPDAQSAGVLVASWIADDLIEAPTPPPSPEPVTPVATPFVTPTADVDHGVIATVAAQRRRGLMIGGMLQTHGEGAFGLRAELDLARHGAWGFGAVLAGSTAHLTLYGAAPGYMETLDLRALAQLSRTFAIGKRWDLRLAFGAGVMYTSATVELPGDTLDAVGVFPTAETSLLISRHVGGWSIVAGPVITWYTQTYKFQDTDEMFTLQRRDLELMAFGGFRRQL
jgi:hypothetical protein